MRGDAGAEGRQEPVPDARRVGEAASLAVHHRIFKVWRRTSVDADVQRKEVHGEAAGDALHGQANRGRHGAHGNDKLDPHGPCCTERAGGLWAGVQGVRFRSDAEGGPSVGRVQANQVNEAAGKVDGNRVDPATNLFGEEDVWSLGITIWEIFEYGAVPYKGVRNIQVQGHLEKGNRLPRPANCPEPVYKHVLSTFESNPHNRPDFQALATTFGRLLAANGGLEQCRDIGSELTGGKEVKATATGDGQGRGFDKRTGASLNRKSRAMSIQQSPKIKLNQNNIFTNQESDSSDDDNSFAEPSSTQHKGIDVADSDSDVDLDEITAKPAPAASPQRKVFNLMGPGGGGEEPEAVFGSGPGPNDDADGEMSTVFNFPATNATLSENSVGMLCQVRNIPCGGTIRFVGNHHAKGDPKVLVELEQPLGRNNGVIGGHTYYACNEKHGVLCNPMDVTILKRTRQPDTAKGGCCTIL